MDVFDLMWDELAEEGKVDGRGLAEYRRVLRTWLEAGCPYHDDTEEEARRLARWIIREANKPSY